MLHGWGAKGFGFCRGRILGETKLGMQKAAEGRSLEGILYSGVGTCQASYSSQAPRQNQAGPWADRSARKRESRLDGGTHEGRSWILFLSGLHCLGLGPQKWCWRFTLHMDNNARRKSEPIDIYTPYSRANLLHCWGSEVARRIRVQTELPASNRTDRPPMILVPRHTMLGVFSSPDLGHARPDLAVQKVFLRLDYFHYYHHRRYHGGGGVSGKEIALMQGVQIAEGEMRPCQALSCLLCTWLPVQMRLRLHCRR